MIKQKAFEKISQLKKEFSDNYNCGNIEEKNYNYEFTLSRSEAKLKVQVYFGKKGVKIVLQGNKDSNLYSTVEASIAGEKTPTINNNFSEPENYIGTDESGKGDYFGPLVTAAAYVDKNTKKELLSIGVRDSKELTDFQIDNMAPKIKAVLKNKFEILILVPEKYNDIYTKIANLNKLLNWCHTKVIENLLNEVECSNIIVDKFSNQKIILKGQANPTKINYFTKAEKYTAVAAASILARNQFNQWFIDKESENIFLPKGASNNVEREAKEFLRVIGLNNMGKFAKLHFKTTRKIQK